MISRLWLTLGLLAAFAGCQNSGTQLVVPATPAPPAANPTPAPTPSPTPAPTPDPNSPPQGAFIFNPPLDNNGGMRVRIRTRVHVNGTGFRDPDGDAISLTVDWGDGTSGHISCGLCKLQHQYLQVGDFKMRAEIADPINRPVRQTVNVVVR